MATTVEKGWAGWTDRIGKNLDIPFILAIIGVLFVIIVPLPPVLLDCLLVLNISLSMLILLTTVYVLHPLDFSAFPSVLLMTTFFRLALNIATTRLILSRAGEDGVGAAGRVVQAFGEFVAGSNALVGFVIFTIIVVIQFVVITKGATRISEVAARFTLDAMPGYLPPAGTAAPARSRYGHGRPAGPSPPAGSPGGPFRPASRYT